MKKVLLPWASPTAADGASYLYVAQSGYPGDAGNYQGHITAINLADSTQKVSMPCAATSQSILWTHASPPGQIAIPRPWRLIGHGREWFLTHTMTAFLMTTGNGTFQPSGFLWGDTVFSLNIDGSSSNGNPLDSYTPLDYQHLQDTDLDLGSTASPSCPLPAQVPSPGSPGW